MKNLKNLMNFWFFLFRDKIFYGNFHSMIVDDKNKYQKYKNKKNPHTAEQKLLTETKIM